MTLDANKTVEDFREHIKYLAGCCLKHPQDFDYSKIVEVLAWEPTVPDEENGYALFRMENGSWGTLDEWEDYTGHG